MTDNNSNYEEYLIKNQQNKLYYQKHKERINEYARKYYDNNRNKLKQYHKIYYLKKKIWGVENEDVDDKYINDKEKLLLDLTSKLEQLIIESKTL